MHSTTTTEIPLQFLLAEKADRHDGHARTHRAEALHHGAIAARARDEAQQLLNCPGDWICGTGDDRKTLGAFAAETMQTATQHQIAADQHQEEAEAHAGTARALHDAINALRDAQTWTERADEARRTRELEIRPETPERFTSD